MAVNFLPNLQTALYEIAQAVNTTGNLSELYRVIHQILGQLMPADNFYIALYDPLQNRISFPYFVDQFDPPPSKKPPGKGLTEYVLRTGAVLLATPRAFEDLVRTGEVELIGGTGKFANARGSGTWTSARGESHIKMDIEY